MGPSNRPPSTDPSLRLREKLDHCLEMAREHGVSSVVVGLAGETGDVMLPDLFEFLEAELRVEDAIVRMTRERAVLFLADVDGDGAAAVLERLVSGFCEHFPLCKQPQVAQHFFVVGPESGATRLKDVLPTVFPAGHAPGSDLRH